MKIGVTAKFLPISSFVLVVIAFEDLQSHKEDLSIQNGQAEQTFIIEIESDLNSRRRPWTPAGFSRRKKWFLRLQTSVSAVDWKSFASPKQGLDVASTGFLNTNDTDGDGLKIWGTVGRGPEDTVEMEVPPSDEASVDLDLDVDEYDDDICGTESTIDTTTTTPTDTTPSPTNSTTPTTTTDTTTTTTTTTETGTESTTETTMETTTESTTETTTESTTSQDPRDSTASSDPTSSTPTSSSDGIRVNSRRKTAAKSTRRRKIVDCSTATTEESTTSSDVETSDTTFSTSSTIPDTSNYTTSEVSPTVTKEANVEVSNETFMSVFGGILAAATVAVYAWHMRNLFKFKVAMHVGKNKSYLEL